jgi:hypothetical protein
MTDLYILGGRQRRDFTSLEEEWFLFEKALIIQANAETGAHKICVEYETPAEARATERSSILFKAGARRGDKLYACTSTEVMIYKTPEFERLVYISLPCFNDLHYVCPTPDNNLMVVITGLDMVAEITPEGKVLREWSVLFDDPWQRFSRQTDYRKVPSNKPYRAHPNFVFWIGQDLWVTRADLKDAVCLTHANQRIGIDIQMVHDGVPFQDHIYFTSVDGKLVKVNQKTLQIDQTIDLNYVDNPDRALLGWCRGVYVVDEKRVWVGFTRVRKTKWKEKVLWVKQQAFGPKEKPTRIALYDLEAQKILQEIDLEDLGMNAVFNMLPAGDATLIPLSNG